MEELVSIMDLPLTSSEVRRVLSRFSLTDQIFEPLEKGMPAERFLTDKSRGVQIEVRPGARIGTIFLYPFGRDGFGQFPYPLIAGLTFSSGFSDVLERLGDPSSSARLDPPAFEVAAWAKYVNSSHSVHFSFGVAGAMNLVTLMPPDWQPGGYGGG